MDRGVVVKNFLHDAHRLNFKLLFEVPLAGDNDEVQVTTRGAARIAVGDELAELVTTLNSGQQAIFGRVINHLRHQRLHQTDCKDSDVRGAEERCSWCQCLGRPRPLRLIVQGGAGTGKSRLISAITGQSNRDALLPPALLCQPVGSKEESEALAGQSDVVQAALAQPLPDVTRHTAPTGVAAYLIGGTTLHSTFKIPVVTSMDRPTGYDLSGEALKTKKLQFKNTVLIILDEV